MRNELLKALDLLETQKKDRRKYLELIYLATLKEQNKSKISRGKKPAFKELKIDIKTLSKEKLAEYITKLEEELETDIEKLTREELQEYVRKLGKIEFYLDINEIRTKEDFKKYIADLKREQLTRYSDALMVEALDKINNAITQDEVIKLIIAMHTDMENTRACLNSKGKSKLTPDQKDKIMKKLNIQTLFYLAAEQKLKNMNTPPKISANHFKYRKDKECLSTILNHYK